ncbi:HAD family hydrolase [Psychromonas sp. PT13]|uniref:HAD family hydrolase n=1 Tax=Psychromonas sp. PT13 TaxID=3439547 RepID=UPI003EBD03E8
MPSYKIFDICGTLYNSNTTMDFCEWRCDSLILKSLLRLSKTLPLKVVNKILIKLFHFDFIRVFHIYTLKNKTVEQIKLDSLNFVDAFLEFKKIDEVHEQLARFQKEDILLVSATIEPVAKAIAERLGNIEYLSTTLDCDNEIYVGKILEDLLGNKHQYFQGKKIDFIITDNKSDYELCLMSKEINIVSKEKNVSFWESKKLKNYKMIKVL